MNVIRCRNGHFFDGDSYGTCPHCGESAMPAAGAAMKEEKKSFWGRGRKEKEAEILPVSSVPSVTPSNNFGSGNTATDVMERNKTENSQTPPLKKNPTLDFWQTSAHPEGEAEQSVNNSSELIKPVETEEKLDQKDMPAQEQPKMDTSNVRLEELRAQAPSSSLRETVKKSSANNEGKTMSYFSAVASAASERPQHSNSAEPVVGWLVCVGGCHFGESFSIYAGKNSVGRSEENHVVISGDSSISRIKHALIVYEPKRRNFYLQPGDSSGLTYLNDDYITDSHKLSLHDIVELGESKFMFIPLCGETFSWEDHMPKGE